MGDEPIAIPNRPDPTRAPELFREHGMRASPDWFLACAPEPCGCYVGALLADACGGFEAARLERLARGNRTLRALSDIVKIPQMYVYGLDDGFSFDEAADEDWDAGEVALYRAGFADGRAALAAVKAAGMLPDGAP